MKIGVIADDFTGASDIALTLSQAGMRTVQYSGTPSAGAEVGANAAVEAGAEAKIEAGVIALKSRTIPVAQAVDQSLEACRWLEGQGAQQIIYKVCSTFDSTSAGNIGQVTQALAEHLGETRVIVCPAFPENGRSVYQGHLFVNDVLLNASGMENHPLTPMTDADLRRVLATQTTWPVEHIAATTVLTGADAIAAALAKGGPAMIVVDAIRDADLMAIGRAARGRKLLTGGSGIALGLPANFDKTGGQAIWVGQPGSGVVLSGSCSTATRRQVARYAKIGPTREITAEEVMTGALSATGVATWALTQKTPPLIYSSADPAVVAKAQGEYGRKAIAAAIEHFFQDLAAELARRGIERIVVAGGETSGAVTQGLGATALELGPKIAPGVPALRVQGGAIALALKSGNFGDDEFFQTALDVLAGAK